MEIILKTCFEANINNIKTSIEAMLWVPLFMKEEIDEAYRANRAFPNLLRLRQQIQVQPS
jgi:hypothetical protein